MHAFDRAGEATKKRAAIGKRNYDVNARDSCLYPGDGVLVRNLSVRGKHKLSNWWEDNIHHVIEKVNDLPVYKVKSEKTGRLRVLHRDLLLPLSTFEEDSMHTTLEISHDIILDGSVAHPEARTRSGRVSRPPKRCNVNIRCYRKVQKLLSLVNNTDHILVKEVLSDCFNEPIDQLNVETTFRGNCVVV